MIRFEGEFSSASKHFLSHQAVITGIIVTSVTFLLCLFFPIMLANILSMMWILYVYIGMFVAILTLIIISDYSVKMMESQYKCEKLKFVEIADDGYIEVVREFDGYEFAKHIDDVKEVGDYGEFYYIVFSRPNAEPSVLCQKDLIVKGSIEEFEKFFDGKIIKKRT